jgi:4-amino-4-deoxy-L-arabinose transferase-like glycosyltransferase
MAATDAVENGVPKRGLRILEINRTWLPQAQRPWWKKAHICAAVAAVVVRVGMILWQHSYEIFPDAPFILGWETGSIAHSIATGQGFSSPFGIPTGPTAWIAPVYPYLCAGVFRIFGIYTTESRFAMLLLSSVFSALTCIPIYHLARRTVGEGVGLWSAWAWALLPHFSKWATTIVWETSLSALLVVLLAVLAFRVVEAEDEQRNVRACLVWGTAAGIAALANPALVTFIPICAVWFWRRMDRRRFWRGAVVAAIVCTVLVGPWLLRNRVVLGEWVFLRDNYGFEFHLGNFHNSNGMGWRGLHPTQNDRELQKYRTLGEVAYIADAKRQAMDFVKQWPGEFASLCWQRFVAFWDGGSLYYSPSPQPWNGATFYGFSLLSLFGLICVTARRMPGVLLFWWIPVYAVPYYLSYPHARYRHAVEPLMLLLAVFFVAEVARSIAKVAKRRGAVKGEMTRENAAVAKA